MPDKQDSLAQRGLTLSRRLLRRLDEVGIFAQSQVSLEHQHLAKRYVVRGMESGGAVKDQEAGGPDQDVEELDPELGDAPIVRKRIDNARIETAMSNSFGFGGTNATLVFQRHAA